MKIVYTPKGADKEQELKNVYQIAQTIPYVIISGYEKNGTYTVNIENGIELKVILEVCFYD